jgi:hypothetical protein
MKTILSIAIAALLGACAGMAPRAQASRERWQGFLLRNGLREPVSLELTEAGSAWDGRLSAGDNYVPLEAVRVSGSSVHFELAGAGIFDGSVAGNSMAGSVSGPVKGSFALTRVDETISQTGPYFLGP